MAGEVIKDYGSWVTLESSGASIANNAFAQADDASFDLAADGGNRPDLEFEIEFTFGIAPTANTALVLHAQDLDLFGGTDDMRSPSANYLAGAVASVLVENTTNTQRKRFYVQNAPTKAAYWLQNAGTTQTLSSGWKLRARAVTVKAA